MTRSIRARFFAPSANNRKGQGPGPGGAPGPGPVHQDRAPLPGGDDVGQHEIRMDERPRQAVAVVEAVERASQRGAVGAALGSEPLCGGSDQASGRRNLVGRGAVGEVMPGTAVTIGSFRRDRQCVQSPEQCTEVA